VVPHHSTDYAINCLTAQIGRDAVGLVVYGRSLEVKNFSPLYTRRNQVLVTEQVGQFLVGRHHTHRGLHALGFFQRRKKRKVLDFFLRIKRSPCTMSMLP
jgi:hypothetical protein